MNAGPKADDNTRLNAIANTRGALLGVLAPVVVAIGAVAAFLNYRETSDQNRRTVKLSRDALEVTERGQLTERFTKAIDQLGQTAEDKLDIRLGGIYALEQIAKESKELHGPVMEILTAFLREHSREPEETQSARVESGASISSNAAEARAENVAPRLPADFQAIATVLGRRKLSHDPDGFRLDLHGVALGGVDFAHAQLQKASFIGAKLGEAHFEYAQLQGTTFMHAQLQHARFQHAQLQQGRFEFAHLQQATFTDAQLVEANFGYADLQKAIFYDAHLQKASFADADLRKASFASAELQEADFKSAYLQEANFYGARLRGARFSGADLEGTRFTLPGNEKSDAVDLTCEQLREARNGDKALPPQYLEAGQSRPDLPPGE
jgi:uncharacterized protein YjbI with pentapeptide repeats